MAPILGWWPGESAKATQVGWWVLASIVVLAVGITQPVRRILRGFSWGLGGVLLVFFSHVTSVGWSVAWAYQVSFVLLAAWMIAERGQVHWLRQTVLWMAWCQVGLAGLELAGVVFFPIAGNFPHGSLVTRTGLCLLWTMASLWSAQWRAVVFALLACATGSWTGTVAVVRLVWLSGTVPFPLVVVVPGLLLGSLSLWLPKLVSRWEVWRQVYWLKEGWLTGWGFLPFPIGFVSTDPSGSIGRATQVSIYLNNTFLDWVGRTGVIGAVLLGGLVWWAVPRMTVPWRIWTVLGLCWMGLWQSAEALPVLSLLGVCSVIGLAQEE